jgi:arylsulfatase A-like enzyme
MTKRIVNEPRHGARGKSRRASRRGFSCGAQAARGGRLANMKTFRVSAELLEKAVLIAFAAAVVFPAVFFAATTASAAEPLKPNFVVILADDLGYGDLACYGHPTIRTPNLDRMAAQGMRFTDFYVAAEVCTPSRAALMTGRLPIRNGMCHDKRRVLFLDSAGGLPASELTIARMLKARGYATGCVGKWHLGHHPQFLPTRHGFDSYFGIPYSNDMDRDGSVGPKGRAAFFEPKSEYWKPPFMRDATVLERSPDQTQLTPRYTAEALKFIRANKAKPFFLYFAHNFPHVPLFASQQFRGKSRRGLYGDVVEELDWSVGQVLDALRAEGLAENTLVFFTSDNGPWLIFDTHGGSAGLLRDGKGSTWEGGMREPGIAWWPGRIKPGVIQRAMASSLDLLPTFAALAGATLPRDLLLDGVDMSPLLLGKGPGKRDAMFYYRGTQLFAVRKGPFKAHFITRSGYDKDPPAPHDPPLLFDLGADPGERFDVAKDHPDALAAIAMEVERHRATVTPVRSQLEDVVRRN